MLRSHVTQAAGASGVVVRAIVERASGLREAMNHVTEDAIKPLQDKRLALVFLLDNMIRVRQTSWWFQSCDDSLPLIYAGIDTTYHKAAATWLVWIESWLL